jgi:peroxiredoxin Q/BCP
MDTTKQYGGAVGSRAPDFSLIDQDGKEVTLQSLFMESSLLIVFYPGDFTLVCTKQLCNYQDHLESFKSVGVQVVGVSSNSKESHKRFSEEYRFQFPLLHDPKGVTAKSYGCSSLLMMGGMSRAVFIINPSGHIVYRYVEPTVLSRRKSGELLAIIENLKITGMLT